RQRPASSRTAATDFRRGLRKTVADGARPVALVAGAVLLSCFRVLADSVVGRVVAGTAQAKMPRRLHSRVGAGTALASRKLVQLTFGTPGGKDHEAQRSGPRPLNEVLALPGTAGTGHCPVALLVPHFPQPVSLASPCPPTAPPPTSPGLVSAWRSW